MRTVLPVLKPKWQNKRWIKIERISFVASIIGMAVGIITAGVTIYFAVKTYYNTEQINELKNLNKTSSKNTDTLIAVINELRKENHELNFQTNQMRDQTKILSDQLQMNQKEISVTERASAFKLSETLNKI